MHFISQGFLLLVIIELCSGCAKEQARLVDLPTYREMKNVTETPPVLRQAAQAIVKLHTFDGHTGTASFISPDGQLLTNNHVLGIGEGAACALEGCHVEIYQDYQIGNRFQKAIPVFAEPVHVNQELDASVFQLWTDSSKHTKYHSPAFLVIEPLSSEQLQGQSVNIIGHPLGSVKKWVSGQVYRQCGNWFYATNYTLPGNSGSPYLNDEGKIIGLHHRHSTGNDRITRRDVLYHAIGTASSELSKMLIGRSRTHLFFSVKQPHPLTDIADNHEAYLMAHVGEALLDNGKKVHVLDALGQKCDEAVRSSHFTSPDQMESKLSWCSKAWLWMDCRNKDSGGYKKCPTGPDKEKWIERLQLATEHARVFNTHRFYRWLISLWRLEETQESALNTERRLLNEYLNRVSPPLSFELAYYLIDLNGGQIAYSQLSVADFIKNFRNQPRYEFQYDWIINGHLALFDNEAISKSDFAKAINEIFNDDKLDLGNKLDLESIAYQMDLL